MLLVPNQTSDKYVMMGLINGLYKSIVHSCLRVECEQMCVCFAKVLLMCALQFKRLSRCKPGYLIGVSLGVQVIWVFSIEMLGMLCSNLRGVNVVASFFFVELSVNFHLLNQSVSSTAQVCIGV